ncbi:MAG: hypothetical protein ACJARG_002125, partial [Arcticibacterium sp.]
LISTLNRGSGPFFGVAYLKIRFEPIPPGI